MNNSNDKFIGKMVEIVIAKDAKDQPAEWANIIQFAEMDVQASTEADRNEAIRIRDTFIAMSKEVKA